MGRPASLARFVLPSAVAAALAAAAGGLVEAVPDTASIRGALAATGFLALVLLPLGLAVSLALRGLVRAWRPTELAARLTEPHGGAPRLAAWLTFLVLAAAALATAVFNILHAVMVRSDSAVVHLLTAPIAAAAVALALAALSRPTVDGLTALYTRVERRQVVRTGRGALRPVRVVAVTGAVAVAALVGSWQLSIAPRIGHLDLAVVRPLGVWLALVVGLPLVGPAVARRPAWTRAALGLAVVVTVAPVGSALWLRATAPGAMIELWADTRLAGLAIDVVFDIEVLRDEMDLAAVAPVARPGARHPDVVLITIDTVRADQTPLYGGTAAMPALAGLAEHGVVFEYAFSPGNVTRRSLPAIATGRSPGRVRGRVAGWALKLDPRHILLAERFAAAGYDTVGFFCCESQFGARHRLGLTRGLRTVEIEYDGGALAEQLAAFLAARPAEAAPMFLWVHFIEPHNWERDQPAKAGVKTKRQRYGKSLEEVDGYLGAVVAAAFPPTRRDRTVLVVTSDHGEALGDHGSRTHAMTLFNPEVRVPLVIAAPGARTRRVLAPVGLVDLAPTLLDLAGFAPPALPDMDGASLAGLVTGAAPGAIGDGRAYMVQLADRSVAETQRAVVLGRHKLIVDGDDRPTGLYDFVADRAEAHDLRTTQPAVLQALQAELARRRAIDRTP